MSHGFASALVAEAETHHGPMATDGCYGRQPFMLRILPSHIRRVSRFAGVLPAARGAQLGVPTFACAVGARWEILPSHISRVARFAGVLPAVRGAQLGVPTFASAVRARWEILPSHISRVGRFAGVLAAACGAQLGVPTFVPLDAPGSPWGPMATDGCYGR